jgi:5'-3' exonuclease
MLTGEMIANKNLWLLREKQEFGANASNLSEKQEYTFMNLEEFKLRVGVKGVNEVLNYVGLMSLMGNDFLPHSLTHKLNDDGHDCVLSELRAMKRSETWLVNLEGRLQKGVLLGICQRWAAEEEVRIGITIRKKRDQAVRGVGKGMDESEGLPLQWNVEKVMFQGDDLKEDWRAEYWKFIHPFADRGALCSEYIYGLQWILDYYTGQAAIDNFWMFPSWVPPLWSDLVHRLKEEGGVDLPLQVIEPLPLQAIEPLEPIKPTEQLAMVLPLDSWGLIKDKAMRRLPALLPQMWPSNYTFFSLGRKWLWECEARIPVLTAERVREILKEAQ